MWRRTAGLIHGTAARIGDGTHHRMLVSSPAEFTMFRFWRYLGDDDATDPLLDDWAIPHLTYAPSHTLVLLEVTDSVFICTMCQPVH